MKILLVDDDSKSLDLLEAILLPQGYGIVRCCDGKAALEIIEKEDIDLVLSDVIMPGISGFELTETIKAKKKVPVILLTSLREKEDVIKGFESGADEFLFKPYIKEELLLRVRNVGRLKEYQDTLRQRVNKRTAHLKETLRKIGALNREMIFRLLTAAEYRDDETGRHIIRVSKYSKVIAESMGFERKFLELIEVAALMHDLGKVGIPDKILLKPGKLTAEEFEIMKTHTTIGAKILEGSKIPLIVMAQNIALNHHEKWDGSGYPRGIKGEDIPIAGRIVALSDIFDALTTRRPYKPAFPWEKSIEIIKEEENNHHLDSKVTEEFFKRIDDIKAIYNKYSDTGEKNIDVDMKDIEGE